jgi:hypothetical protein
VLLSRDTVESAKVEAAVPSEGYVPFDSFIMTFLRQSLPPGLHVNNVWNDLLHCYRISIEFNLLGVAVV